MENTTPSRWAQAFPGLILIGLSLAANTVDIVNNWDFGYQVSFQRGLILASFAVAVWAIPTAAGFTGWRKFRFLYAIGLLFALGITIGSSFRAYSSKDDGAILATENKQSTWTVADKAAKQAETMLKSLPVEASTAEGLQAELKTAQEKLDACTRWCGDLTKARDTLQKRLTTAQSRDHWQAKLDAAEAKKAEGGAAKFASDAAENERFTAWLWNVVFVLGTPILALFGGPGAWLLNQAFVTRPAEKPATAPKVRRKPGRREAVLAAYDKLSGLSNKKAAEHLKVAPATLKRWLDARDEDRAAQEALLASGKVAKLRA